MVRNVVSSAAIAAAAAAMAVALAVPAAAAPTAGSAQETIDKLQADGYKVIVSKVGSGAIDKCSVKSVRQGNDVKHSWIQRGPVGNVNPLTRYTTVYVDLSC